MVRFKVEWSLEARLDFIDILEFYIKEMVTQLIVKSYTLQ